MVFSGSPGVRSEAGACFTQTEKGLKLPENARLFALLTWLREHLHQRLGCEVHLQLLAPGHAIRNGDIDGNDATERDAGWTPLNETPMHPEYPSQATTGRLPSEAPARSA